MISLLRVSSSGLSRVSLLKERQERPSLLTHCKKKLTIKTTFSQKKSQHTLAQTSLDDPRGCDSFSSCPQSVVCNFFIRKKKTIRAKKIHIAPHIFTSKIPSPSHQSRLGKIILRIFTIPIPTKPSPTISVPPMKKESITIPGQCPLAKQLHKERQQRANSTQRGFLLPPSFAYKS